MLVKRGLLDSKELKAIEQLFESLQAELNEGTFVIDAQFEDIHSKLEYELTKVLGDTGKKIHTARSRNDQVLVALQLYYKANLKSIKAKTKTIFETLIDLAETHKNKFGRMVKFGRFNILNKKQATNIYNNLIK